MKNIYLRNINNWFSSLYTDDNIASLPIFSRKTIIITLSLIIIVFYFHFLLYINESHNPHFDDYTYFHYVNIMSKAGGIPNFIQNYIDGVMGYYWTPLFTFLLTPFFEKSYTFFSYGNYINLIFGIFMILAVYHVGKKLFNSNFIGLVAALLISLNFVVLTQTSVLATENMLILFSSLSFFFFIKGLDNNKYWLLALLTALLAYISKANGLLVIISQFLVIILLWKRLKYKYLTLAIAIAVFSLSIYIFKSDIQGNASIFLWKNVGVYDSEYHGYLKHNQFYSSILEFFRNNPMEFTRRIIWGITKDLHRYAISLLFSIEYNYKSFFMINTGILLVPFFFYLILKDHNWKRKYPFFTFSILIFIALIPRASVDHNVARYSIAVVPIFYFYLAPIIYRLALFIKQKWNISLKSLTIATISIAIITNSIIFSDSYSQISLFPKFDKSYQKALNWLKENTKENDTILIESNSKLKFNWYTNYKLNEIISTSTIKGKYIEDNKLIQYSKNNKVKYIISDSHAIHTLTKKNVYFFPNYIKKINDSLIINKEKMNKNLKIVFQDANPPKRIIILKLE